MRDGQALHTSPYVTQIEKYADSLKRLSRIFLKLEGKKQAFSNEEIEDMFDRVKENVCKHCEKCSWCWGEHFVHTYQMGYEILSAVDHYGSELNTETKRKLQQKCEMAPRFLREMLDAFHDARQTMIWNNRIVQSREGCAIQMDTFADMIRSTAKELEKSLFLDERLEKKIIAHLKRKQVRVLYTNFFLNQDGKFEIHVTAKSFGNTNVTIKELVRTVSEAIGRRLIPESGQGFILGKEYQTVVCMEGPAYYTLYGVARIGKDCNKISGDNFMMRQLPGGRVGAALSDGMGSGEKACRESTMVIELLEELLEAGFPEKAAIQMINTTLVMGREEIHFSTVDMSVFDLYTGTCRLLKAGASSTYLKKGTAVERISSSSLPIGVMHSIEIESVERTLENGDFVVMVTDGILDALPVGEQDLILETIIKGTNSSNPKELAHHILEQVLSWTAEEPMDDMTVLVVGLWESRDACILRADSV